MENKKEIRKKRNPRENANFLSALTFSYMLPIFRRTYKHGFTEDDLFDALDEHKSSTLGDKVERIWHNEIKKHKKTALHRALLKAFGFEFVIIGIFKLIHELMLVTVMPLSIGGLVSYFEGSGISEEWAYIYAAMIIACILIDSVLNHSTMMGMMHIAMKLRVACCSLIYRKSLRLSHSALANTTIGQMVNLLSNDVSKFDHGFVLAHYVWIGPIQTAVGAYLLYREIRVSALIGIAFLLSFVPLQIYLAKRTSVLRLRTAIRTDERVRLMNEIISGIQVIKMYTWEKPFAKLIALARRYEIKAIRKKSYLFGLTYSLEQFLTRTSIFISIVAYAYFGNDITGKKVFAISAVYNVIRPIMTILFSISVSSLAEVHISINRLQCYMSYEELPTAKLCYNTSMYLKNGILPCNGTSDKEIEVHMNPTPRVVLKNVTAKWSKDLTENTLTDVNLNVNSSQLLAVIGPVGSGKSSLLNVILKELPITTGIVEVIGKISYAAQEPWLFSATVRDNILFGEEYVEKRYQTVVKVCALETDFTLMPYGDKTIVGEKGKSLSGGQKARINLARCVYKEADIYILDDPLSAVDSKVGKQLYDRCIKEFLGGKICILVTHQLQYLKNADHIVILKDGRVESEGKYNDLKNNGLDFGKILQEFNEGSSLNHLIDVKPKQVSEKVELDEDNNEEDAPGMVKEQMGSGSIGFSLYLNYFKAGGGYLMITVLALSFIVAQVASNSGDYYASYWVDQEQEFRAKVNNSNETFPREPIIYTYSGITLATIFMAVSHCLFFFLFFMRASIHLHDYTFSKIIYAVMPFFNANPSGRILNRFSKDLGLIDEYIPEVLIDVIEIALYLLGAIVLTCIVNVWLVLPSLGLMVIFYLLRAVYLETSRSAKRIEGITRSPIFGHMSASINGLSTIRAFKAESVLIKEFDTHQDCHSSAWYLFIASSRAFGFWLDMICIIFIAGVILSLLLINRGYYGGEVGLVITQYLGLIGVLQWGMRQWSELENQMTSVERVLEYTTVETEPIREKTIAIPRDWPENGKIEFVNVSLRYNENDPPVLRNLNFVIQPNEKVGIVGRTGAGKSSTIAALFQLYEIEGSIIIDGVDTTKIPLEELRPKIAIIPQEPVLFTGTMRKNLDPFDEFDDETLWNALEQVELKNVVADLPAGLNSSVFEGGSNFSVGQRQLICLARAIVRKNKILVMDEATANVDPQTDVLIQHTIRTTFANSTVITVAHRLHTIMDSDKVIVMDSGRVAEIGHPFILLQNEQGIFHSMVETTGKSIAKNLYFSAEKSYEKQKNQ